MLRVPSHLGGVGGGEIGVSMVRFSGYSTRHLICVVAALVIWSTLRVIELLMAPVCGLSPMCTDRPVSVANRYMYSWCATSLSY